MNILDKYNIRIGGTTTIFIFILALVFTLTGCQQPQPAESHSKIGYVSVSNITGRLPEVNAASYVLDSLRQDLQAQVTQRSTVLEQRVAAFQARQAAMNESARESELQVLQAMQDTLTSIQQQATNYFVEREGEIMGPLLTRVQEVVDSISDEYGYTYVFNLDAGQPLMMHAPDESRLDSLVVLGLGEAYNPPTEETP